MTAYTELDAAELRESFAGLWPPRSEAVRASLCQAFEKEEWSRVAGDDWRAAATGRFERAFARLHRSRHALALINATGALELCLVALGLRPGDRVIVPALSFVATATAISAAGGVPVFVDVDPDTLNVDPAALDAAAADGAAGAIIVHLAGVPCDMPRIVEVCKRRGLFLVEDCSHAHGSAWDGRPVGTFGDYGVFSLQQGKLLTCGEGAVVTTDDADRYGRLFSTHTFATSMPNGLVSSYAPMVPRNGRLANLLGALLLPQLKTFEADQQRRARAVAQLEQLLAGIEALRPRKLDPRCGSNVGYYQTFHFDPAAAGMTADAFGRALSERGVPAFRGHNTPMYLREPYASRATPWVKARCPVSEQLGPTRFVNFRHEMFLAPTAAISLAAKAIRDVLGGARDE